MCAIQLTYGLGAGAELTLGGEILCFQGQRNDADLRSFARYRAGPQAVQIMAVSQQSRRKLRDVLGDDAAEDLVNNVESMDSIRTDIANLRQEMRDGFAKVREEIHSVRADLMKWSFVFWCGAVAAIAALAGVLRH